MEKMYDYASYEADQSIGGNSLAALRDLAKKQHEKELELAKAEDLVRKLKSELSAINNKALPELLDQLGITEFSTEDGLRIELKEVIRASMGRSEIEKARAFDWLEKHGHGSIIKRTVQIPFSRDQNEEAEQLRKNLLANGYSAQFSKKVEAATLRAFAIEMLRNGEDIPLDIFKVFRDRRTKVEIP